MSFQASDIDQIKSNLDIVQIVGELVPLQKRGKNYFGVCPFHQEKSASFSVSSERQFFHCFGCKVGGDLIQFYQLYYRYDFHQSVEELAKKAGVTLEQSKRSGDWEESLALLEAVAVLFEESLASPPAEKFRDYLKARGIHQRLAEKFRLGAHLGGDRCLYDLCDKKGFSKDLAVRLGILGRTQQGEFMDRFRGRLMFPIADERGRIRGFGGRGLGNELPKYLNSPASPVFDKKKLLYGIELANEAFRLKDYAILVEGYMDVIALHRQGISNCVGSMGTALSLDQVRKLKRRTHRFLSLFDGDEAGLQATERNLEVFIREAITAKVLVLPGAKDPDAFFQELEARGEEPRAAWKSALKGSVPALDFLLRQRVFNESDSVRRAKKLREVVDLLDRSPDPLQRTALKREISERFQIPWEMLDSSPIEEIQPQTPIRRREASSAPEPVIFRETLKFLILWGKDMEFQLSENLSYLDASDPWARILENLVGRGFGGREIHSLDWLSEQSEDIQVEVREWLLEKDQSLPELEDLSLTWKHLTRRLKSEFFKRESNRLQENLIQAEATKNEEAIREILKEKQDLMRMLGDNHPIQMES